MIDYITQLENTSSRTEKTKILEDALACTELYNGFRFAYDKMITFGVKKVIETNSSGDDLLEWDKFHDELIIPLSTRELTGNAALDKINELAPLAGEAWDKFYRRVLIKDFRCGITDKTINSVLKKAKLPLIPVYSCQLAEPADKFPKYMQGKKIIDTKYDGFRINAELNKDTGEVILRTRNGLENKNFHSIENKLRELLPFLQESVVIDGEVISSTFQSLMTQVNRKKNIDTSDSIFMVFDIIERDAFISGKYNKTQLERMTDLRNLLALLGDQDTIKADEYHIVDLDTEEGRQKLEELNNSALTSGNPVIEGIMVKDPNAIYETKRSKNWLKIKPTIDVDLEIIDIEEGTGKYAGMAGALVCEGIDHGKHILTKIGSGLTDDQRGDFWKNKDTLIGTLVELTADKITIAKDSNIYSLRFPRIKRFREMEKGSGKI